jgi:p-cumate 2,3-dioxygenase beta subunit
VTGTTSDLTARVGIDRAVAEDFLYAEAALLDEWRLEEWLALFAPEGTYEVPTPDVGDATPATGQYFIADDAELLRVRVNRLSSRNAHAEQPRSVTHRMITNVVAASTGTVGVTRVRAAFQIHRVRDGHRDPYLGWYDHLLVETDGVLRFLRRRSVLAGEQLRPGSRLSFIL